MKKKPVLISEEVHAKIKEGADEKGTTLDNELRSKYGLEPLPIKKGGRPSKTTK